MQSGCEGSICRHLASAFGNSISIPIAALGLLGHYNDYWATVAVVCNNIAVRVAARVAAGTTVRVDVRAAAEVASRGCCKSGCKGGSRGGSKKQVIL